MTKQTTPRAAPARQRENPLSRPQRGLRSMLIEASPDALIALKPDGTILFWSTGAESVYGYTKEEAVGAYLKSETAKTATH